MKTINTMMAITVISFTLLATPSHSLSKPTYVKSEPTWVTMPAYPSTPIQNRLSLSAPYGYNVTSYLVRKKDILVIGQSLTGSHYLWKARTSGRSVLPTPKLCVIVKACKIKAKNL